MFEQFVPEKIKIRFVYCFITQNSCDNQKNLTHTVIQFKLIKIVLEALYRLP